MKIKSKKEYLKKLKRFEEIFNAKQGTKEGMEANKLAISIKAYEEIHYPIGKSF